MTPSSRRSRGPLPEYRDGRCQQTGATAAVYVAPGFLLPPKRAAKPIVTLHVVAKEGRVQLDVEDARAVRDALTEALEWLS